jgi:hypothetical protein
MGHSLNRGPARMCLTWQVRRALLVEWSGGATGLDQWLPVCLPFRALSQMAIRSCPRFLHPLLSFPNHPLPRQDLHLQACQRLKAAHRNLVFARPPVLGTARVKNACHWHQGKLPAQAHRMTTWSAAWPATRWLALPTPGSGIVAMSSARTRSGVATWSCPQTPGTDQCGQNPVHPKVSIVRTLV